MHSPENDGGRRQREVPDEAFTASSQEPVALRTPPPPLRRRLIAAVMIAALLATGLALIAFSLEQDVTRIGNETLSGTLDLGASVYEPTFEDFSYAEVSWADPKCGVRFHFLNFLEYRDYLDSGVLPPAAINCDRVEAVVEGPLSSIVMANERESGANYTLRFDLYVVSRPRAWLGVVALPLLFAASLLAIMTFLREALVKLAESFSLRQKMEREK